ncbi:MAG TPA: beta-ketoacyl synthase N-terminal-like domain-containing protein [Geomonas sp.]|nr:beta-ketoacyl synthase N-terminal-like domain-containing protein [Geomonas sp.]
MINADNDIVISGVAAISAAGVGTAPLIEALAAGTSKLQPVPEEVIGESGHLWGKADSFRASDYMSPLKARKFDRSSLMAVVATGMALKDAAIDVPSLDAGRIGIVLGCGFGGIAYAEEFLRGYFTSGTEGLVPMLFPNIVPNASASNASIEHKLKGPNVTLIQRFCSAESAFLMAMRFLEEDRADIVVTGGVDELFPGMLKGFKSIGQLHSFGAGFSEGAGLLVLERGAHARARKARILAGVGGVRTIGRLSPGREEEGMERLLGGCGDPALIALSGTATADRELLARLPRVPTLDTGRIIGRALAMGGLSLTALALTLQPGSRGVQLAASPEGPYYAVELTGGDPVSS